MESDKINSFDVFGVGITTLGFFLAGAWLINLEELFGVFFGLFLVALSFLFLFAFFYVILGGENESNKN